MSWCKLKKVGFLGAVLSMSIVLFGSYAHATQGFDWTRYEGETLVVAFETLPYYKFLRSIAGDFEKLTGMKLLMDTIPEQQVRQKKVVEFAARSSSIDVIGLAMHVEKKKFAEVGWYVPLNSYIKDPALTQPNYNWSDFYPGSVNWVTIENGDIMGIPGQFGGNGLYYRKDLFKERGLPVPRTLMEVERAAELLHNPPDLYGWVERGLKNANVPFWNSFMRHLGERLVDEEGNVVATTPKAIRAADIYARLIRNYGPPGSTGYNWYECRSMFMQGRAAMWYGGVTNFAGAVENPEKSKVVGKTGYTALLGPDLKPMAESAQSAIAINPFSKKKKQAWHFIQWATSSKIQLKALMAGTGMPRASLYRNEEFLATTHMPEDWLKFMHQYMSGAMNVVTMLPVIKRVSEYRDIFGVALTKAIEGGDVAQLLKEAKQEFERGGEY